jgi:hypothetical protein
METDTEEALVALSKKRHTPFRSIHGAPSTPVTLPGRGVSRGSSADGSGGGGDGGGFIACERRDAPDQAGLFCPAQAMLPVQHPLPSPPAPSHSHVAHLAPIAQQAASHAADDDALVASSPRHCIPSI